MPPTKLRPRDRVRATRTVTHGDPESDGDPAAVYPHPDYIHAVAGELGTVVSVDRWGIPTVRFDRTGTSVTVIDRTMGDNEYFEAEPLCGKCAHQAGLVN